jgi:aspartate 4-decarboxylase
METKSTSLTQLSPFQPKDELISYAKDQSRSKSATHKALNAGRGNPNWIAATPRDAFFLLGRFALAEARTTRDEGSLAGTPRSDGIAARLRAFLDAAPQSPGARLLQDGLDYATSTLGFDADAFSHELVDGIVGDNDPEPDRMLVHSQAVVQRYLAKTMCDERPPAGTFDLFAVECGAAAMCYVFRSLVENRVLRRGDTIALGAPIFTPYIELPRLASYAFRTVEVRQSSRSADGRHTWQYPDDEIANLPIPRSGILPRQPVEPGLVRAEADVNTEHRVISLVPEVVAWVVGRHVLELNPALLMGAVAGARQNTYLHEGCAEGIAVRRARDWIPPASGHLYHRSVGGRLPLRLVRLNGRSPGPHGREGSCAGDDRRARMGASVGL